MEEYNNFKSFNMQEKPSSFRVMNGGWVIYEKPNFKGKCLYNYEGTTSCHVQFIDTLWQNIIYPEIFLRYYH